MKKIVVSYSGGKDSTLALHRIIESGEWQIDSLLTTLTEGFNRTSVHGVRYEGLQKQAESLGIPLREVWIPEQCSHELYQQRMAKAVKKMKEDGIECIMFGDIFLEDIKNYREKMMDGTGITPIFPIWGEDSQDLIHEFLTKGFKTVVTCVDTDQISKDFAGRVIDRTFIEDYPKNYDICGENGEYHTFVFDGPIFKKPISYRIGETKVVADMTTNKDRFYYVDIIFK